MEWNWGTKIALVFTAFCGLMIFMVIKSFEEDFHLVTEDYYQAELSFQDHIDQVSNAANIDYKPQFTGQPESVFVEFDLETAPVGKIHFYRPENARLDRYYDIDGLKTTISKEDLSGGRYLVKIHWEHLKEKYYMEKEVIIEK